mgnify:CR=1 FL=1
MQVPVAAVLTLILNAPVGAVETPVDTEASSARGKAIVASVDRIAAEVGTTDDATPEAEFEARGRQRQYCRSEGGACRKCVPRCSRQLGRPSRWPFSALHYRKHHTSGTRRRFART